jgi:hypothetical protein
MISKVIKMSFSKEYNNILGIKRGSIFYMNINFIGHLDQIYTLKSQK